MNTNQNKSARESSVIVPIIAAICIVIYMVAMVQGVVRLFLSIEERRTQIDSEFQNISNLATSAGARGFMDSAFIETMNNALLNSSSIEALIISGPDGDFAFERQRGHAITWINNSPRLNNRFGLTTDGLHRPLPIQNLRNVSIQAAASSFNFYELTRILRETLLIVLLGFVIAFFTMLLQLLTNGTAKEVSGKSEEKFADMQKHVRHQSNLNKDDSNVDNDLDIEFDDTPDEAIVDTPKGLYSPRSNIGWEEYTDDRLDSELHRCASTEKDLTLLLIEFTDSLNDSQFKKAAEEVVAFFSSRDLLFERGRQGITVICPGIDLETGLEKARQFHQRISEKIFFNHRTDDCLFIGLTSRAGRLINAGRLLFEATEALNKAKTDHETTIIAFKSDPEKYRKFIASQSQMRP